MLYYLDTVVVIYAVEGNPADKKRAKDHLDALEKAGHRFAISELTRTECLVPVFGPGRRSAAVGLFPVLPRAKPADAEPDCRDARPGQRYPWWSYIPSNAARST